MLEDDIRLTFDEKGRRHTYFHRIYHIRNDQGAEEWDTVSAAYTPWFQNRPIVRARVITSDGKQHVLDPSTLSDSPVMQYDTNIYSDRRTVTAPLPAIGSGAVVEWEYQIQGTALYFGNGESDVWLFADDVPVQHTRFVLTAPKNTPLRTVAKLLPAETYRAIGDETHQRWVLELGPRPPVLSALPLLPPDQPSRPHIAWSTSDSWRALATQYASVVERQVQDADLSALGPLPSTEGRSREQVIDELLRMIHRKVRYVGIELGDGAIVPRRPVEVLANRYGDCKDKAVLLVAALRRISIPAHVALLKAGTDEDIDPSLPGINLFNHAIAYIPGLKPLWIDATAEHAKLGILPNADHDRLALIASPETTEPIRTPPSSMEDNWSRHTFEFTMTDPGPAKLTETIEAGGDFEMDLRSTYTGEDTKQLRDGLKSYAERSASAEDPSFVQRPDRYDLSKQFLLRWQSPKSKRALVEDNTGAVVIFPQPLVSDLPFVMLWNDEGNERETPEDEESAKWRKQIWERDGTFALPQVYWSEYKYVIHPPRYFRPKDLPPTKVENLGPAKLTSRFSRDDSGTVHVLLRLEVPKTRLTAAEAREMRSTASEFSRRGPIVIELLHEAEEDLALGRVKEGLEKLRSAARENPSSATHQARLARAYLQIGLGRLAREAAERAVSLQPDSAEILRGKAFILQHDLLGRQFRPGWDRAGAITALKKSLELDKDNLRARAELGICYEHDVDGERYSSRAQSLLAIEEYKRAGAKLAATAAAPNLALALMATGQYEAMEKEAQQLGNAPLRELLHYTGLAMRKGPGAMLIAAQSEIPDIPRRVQAIDNTVATLLQMRAYVPALELMRASNRLVSSAPGSSLRLEMLAKARRSEELPEPSLAPAVPVFRLLSLVFRDQASSGELKGLFSTLAPQHGSIDNLSDAIVEPLRNSMRAMLSQFRLRGIGRETLADLRLSNLQFETEGNEAHGYRVVPKITGDYEHTPLYVTLENGRWVIGGTPRDAGATARHILRFIGEKKLDAARQWMDWLTRDLESASRSDDLTWPPVRFLWSGVTPETRSETALRIAVASVIASETSENTVEVDQLKKALLVAQNVKDRQHLNLALALGYRRSGQWPAMVDTCKRLHAVAPKSGGAFLLLIEALIGSENLAEAQRLAEARLKLKTQTFKTNVELDDEEALKAKALVAIARNDWKTAAELYDRMAKQRNFDEELKATALWVRIRAGLVDRPPFELAEEKGAALGSDARGLLAEAMSLASQGHALETRERLTRHADRSGAAEYPPAYAVILGKMAEVIGEVEETRRFYATVPPAPLSSGLNQHIVASFAHRN